MPETYPYKEIEERRRSDLRSPKELAGIILRSTEEHDLEAEHAYGVFSFRARRNDWEYGVRLLSSSDAEERSVAARILAQFGFPERVFDEETVAVLLRALEKEEDSDVRSDLVAAVGWHYTAEAEEALLSLTRDEDPIIRYHVSWALGIGRNSPSALAAGPHPETIKMKHLSHWVPM